MNDGIEFTPVRCKKISFLNEAQAIFYIDKLKSTSTRTKVPTRAYLCQDCLNWHLTSKGSYAEENPLISEVQKKNETLDAQVTKSEAKIKVMEAQVQQRNGRIKRLERNLAESYAKIRDLKVTVENLRSDKHKLKNQLKNQLNDATPKS